MKILKEVSLKSYNTFRIDAKAKYFAEVKNEDELIEILTAGEYKNIPKLILGGGSNILLTKDFDGLVLKISLPGIEIIDEDDETIKIKAGAGVIWHDLVLFCVERNYGGIENLSLIPGTVGAAPIQNIGAYGQELKDVFDDLEGIQLDDLKSLKFKKVDCRFGYRDSIFKNELKNKFIIMSVAVKLSKKPILNLDYGNLKSELENLKQSNIGVKQVSDVISKIRRSKLPDPEEIGNAGSFFKNPEIPEVEFIELKKDFEDSIGYTLGNGRVKVSAGWLIEKCGWKGKRVGNTGSHIKQSLVLVNYGNASGSEVLNLAKEIKKSVQDKFGIDLKEEVNVI